MAIVSTELEVQDITTLPKRTASGIDPDTDFVLGVEENGVAYKADIEDLGQSIVQGAKSNLLGRNQTVASAFMMLREETNEKIKESYGAPLVANQASDMKDKTRVYVYTGHESGYHHHGWYYWNNVAWTLGDEYNAGIVTTDATLTLADMPADAKAVGDALEEVNTELSSIADDVEQLQEDSNGYAVSTSIAPEYSTSGIYAVGDYCTHDGALYRCTTAIATAEAWNASHWTADNVKNIADGLKGDVSNLKDDLNDTVKITAQALTDSQKAQARENIGAASTGAGISDIVKTALLNCFQRVAWTVGNGEAYYDALYNALYGGSGGIYIGTLVAKLGSMGSGFIGNGYVALDTNSFGRRYTKAITRIRGDLTSFAFMTGDTITIDDSNTYALALGTSDQYTSDIWIGSGYLPSLPYTVRSEDISSIKMFMIKRSDNGNLTQEDVDYIHNHLTVSRDINKTIVDINVVYDNETVYLETDNLALIRHHLTVTVTDSENNTFPVTLYDLFGNVKTGTVPFTVSFGGITATVNINIVKTDYYLRSVNPNSSSSTHALYFNISNDGFNVGDVLKFPEYGNTKYAIGTNGVPYDDWISGGYISGYEYTLQSNAEVNKIQRVYIRNDSVDISADDKISIFKSRIFAERVAES